MCYILQHACSQGGGQEDYEVIYVNLKLNFFDNIVKQFWVLIFLLLKVVWLQFYLFVYFFV